MLIVGILLFQVFSQSGCNPRKDHITELLEKLDIREADFKLDKKDRQEWKKSYEFASKELKEMGTNSFPFLIKELNSFTCSFPIEKNKKKAKKAAQLMSAFDILGTNLAPLLPEFESCLNTNRNYRCAIFGIKSLGKPAVHYLVDILNTNNNPDICAVTVQDLSDLGWRLNEKNQKIDSDLAKTIIKELTPYLRDPDEYLNLNAIRGIEIYCQDAKSGIQPLLENLDGQFFPIRAQMLGTIANIQNYFQEYDPQVDIIISEINERNYEDETEARIIKHFCTEILERKGLSARNLDWYKPFLNSHSITRESIK